MNEHDLLFPTCYRCGAQWEPYNANASAWTKICRPCRLKVSPYAIELTMDKYVIYWWDNADGKRTAIYKAEPYTNTSIAIGKPVYINSWIPFTATPEKIKIYLLFS